MLPDVNERLEDLAEEHATKHKKKKKDKKSKKAKKEKKKKNKKEKRQTEEMSGDSSLDSEEEWVETEVKPESSSTEKPWQVKTGQSDSAEHSSSQQREEWMTLDFMSLKAKSVATLKAEKQKEKLLEQEQEKAREQAEIEKRELNPYWKDGGTGLPPDVSVALVKKATAVEDGGLSWLRKSYQRMKEQAEREERNVEDVVAERYGSMEKFRMRMEEAEKALGLQKPRETDFGKQRWRMPRNWESESCKGSKKGQYEKKDDYCKAGQERKRDKELLQNLDRQSECEYSMERHRNVQTDVDTEGKNLFENKVSGESKECKDVIKESRKKKDLNRVSEEAEFYDRRQEKYSSLTTFKSKFLKPPDDEDSSTKSSISNIRHTESSRSLSSCFRRPKDDSDGESEQQKVQTAKRAKEQVSDSYSFLTEEFASKEEKNQKVAEEKAQRTQEVRSPVQREHTEGSSISRSSMPEKSAPGEELVRILSDEEMNKLGAKLVKAELMGNEEMAASLKAQLEQARKLKESQAQATSATPARRMSSKDINKREEHEVVLIRTDQAGRAWPLTTMEALEPKGGRRKRQLIETHVGKERVRYFQDDDDISLKDMVKREKMGTAEDQNALFTRMASKFMEKTDRDYYTLDDMFISSSAKKERSGKEEEWQRQKAVSEHKHLAARMEKCPYCFDSPELPKHMIVAVGKKVYICLPSFQSLSEGHCLIIPIQHHCAATLVDEDIWDEVQKAIMESDEEWAMNKKLIDLSLRDIRRSVPKALPYFSVDFGLQGGFAHVIENEYKFPRYFGKEILGGMMDLEPRRWRKPMRENFEDQRKKVMQFAQWWKPYDCTKE
ncbi:CWF19-like protein 2 isoform X2 [Protopterus annectens]|uniref:CWF19-like protein 2 isoform X2 n=1 Tax=Protopterus annectens TaxID=7888 RepID=UPI001CFA020D|nr:CWF19-like protein 2 isoform X2 [Protopterus annectens]